MIRINLLKSEPSPRAPLTGMEPSARLALACAVVLCATAIGLGGWSWWLARQSARAGTELAAAQREAAELQGVLADVERFETRRAQLQQRVALIDRLRRGQRVSVRLLDHVSRSLPDTLWLTALTQRDDTVTIEGRSTTLVSLSDFVANLGDGPLLRKPIEIVTGEAEPSVSTAGADADVVRFSVKAQLADTEAP